jgi:hypothetical protein
VEDGVLSGVVVSFFSRENQPEERDPEKNKHYRQPSPYSSTADNHPLTQALQTTIPLLNLAHRMST